MILYAQWTLSRKGRSLATLFATSTAFSQRSQGLTTHIQLHKVIVSPMLPSCRLTILFDCCHSGSAVELPYVYRPDDDGRIRLVNNVKQGISLASAAAHLVQGGLTIKKVGEARSLFSEARTFFHNLNNPAEPPDESGLGEERFQEDWKGEGKDVWMFSGCMDDQTSADTSINGAPTGSCWLHFPHGAWLLRTDY
jgi:metacaspase-1